MTNPTATLHPTGAPFESSGELAIDTIRGLSLTIWRNGERAEATVRNGETRIGGGKLRWRPGVEWHGRITIHRVPWDVLAIRDAKVREWRVTLSIPPDDGAAEPARTEQARAE
jgi:hypothetical protein